MSLGGLLGAKGEHERSHLPVVIRLVELKRTTFLKTKLRDLSFWTLVSLHRCSTFRFLEFNDDLENHCITRATVTLLSEKQASQCVNDTYLCEAFLTFFWRFFDEFRLDETSAVVRHVLERSKY